MGIVSQTIFIYNLIINRISPDEKTIQSDKFEMIRLQLDYEAIKCQKKDAEDTIDDLQRISYQLQEQLQ